ncbi:MAG: hypothetical protein CMN30_32795 [Sandaracinus sp.]|nr:hypothetical protein [Sandaracinus sp.]
MSLPDDLVLRPAAEATQRIALALLDEADAASERLDDADDSEALHDFRVAVRRLRSCARAHRRHLGDILDRKKREKLKALQGLTGGARDTEVQKEHVERFAHGVDAPDAHAGIEAVLARLDERLAAASAGGVKKARKRFAKLERKLRDPLGRTTVSLVHEEATYGTVLAGLAREHVAELADLLSAAESADDAKPLHRARIATKRLRYLVEPLRGRDARVGDLVLRLKRLQDVLGHIQDMHVLEDTLGELGADAPDAHAAGYVALKAAVETDLHASFGELEAEFLGERLGALVDSVEELARGLDGARQTETERKYLLERLPACLEESDASSAKELRQGYVPGEKLRERLREVIRGDERRLLRTLKGGTGVQRIEVEEDMEPALFERMWPLTEGARVHKRRYTVLDGALEWVVDEFLDRELVLAEVELPSADVQPPIPEWMAPHLVREVTGEDAYVNQNLAS